MEDFQVTRPKILVTDPFPGPIIEKLESYGEVTYLPAVSNLSLKKMIYDKDVLIIRSRTKVSSDLLRHAKHLKAVITATHGIDHVDVAELKKKGIKFYNIAEQTNAVAEMVFALLLAMFRDLFSAISSMKQGEWKKGEMMGTELSGKSIGIIGYGRIGRRVAEIASKGFKMRVLAHDAYLTREAKKHALENGVQLIGFYELLKNSEIISVHLPLTEEVHDLINHAEFALMKDGVYLLNLSRGSIVNEEALFEALERGKVTKAALDVFAEEPPTNKKLIAHKNLVATPHIAGQTIESRISTVQKIIEIVAKIVNENQAVN